MKAAERIEEGPCCPRCRTANKAARSFCRVCGNYLKVAKPVRRSALEPERKPIKRGRAPKPMSERRLSQQERRADVVAEVRARDKTCQAGAVHALAGIPCEGPLDCHERISRAQWAEGFLEPSNVVLICRSAHRHITTHPHFGHAVGLVLWSWERPEGAGLAF